jgi:hypothetical protein
MWYHQIRLDHESVSTRRELLVLPKGKPSRLFSDTENVRRPSGRLLPINIRISDETGDQYRIRDDVTFLTVYVYAKFALSGSQWIAPISLG